MNALAAVRERTQQKFSWLSSIWLNIVWSFLLPSFLFWGMEWLHRKSLLTQAFWQEHLLPHPQAFLFGWGITILFYLFFSQLIGRHWPAVLVMALVLYAFGIVTYFKLTMRGEPLLPWDFLQLNDFMAVADNVVLKIEPQMIVIALLFIVCTLFSFFIKMPVFTSNKRRLLVRTICAAFGLLGSLSVFFGVYMNKSVCSKFNIIEDMWMQDRYYRNYGIVTGFLTNLRVMSIDEPEHYSREAIEQLVSEIIRNDQTSTPLYKSSYASRADSPEKSPNIIYVMNESFWDVSRLQDIVFDRDLTPNLQALAQQGAYGRVFSPSFGGGTCDVEFEAITGWSMEPLPAGSKPYQQYVTKELPALPSYLKKQGYTNIAIHGYGEKMWSRNIAYPRLGFDDFISIEDMQNPEKRRGFVSDMEMTRQIIAQYEAHEQEGPVFIHAVTMQNHTTYDEARYPSDELVQILQHPNLSEETLSQLKDFATGIYEADFALGALVDYFSKVDKPTIIVFWGDHYNPLGKGYELFEKTGYIRMGERNSSPRLRETDLLMWCNYDDNPVELGTIASYEITPVMMDLYGLEKPLYFKYLTQLMPIYRARTRGITVDPDGSFSSSLTSEQEEWSKKQWLLQYDQMFGKNYLQAIEN